MKPVFLAIINIILLLMPHTAGVPASIYDFKVPALRSTEIDFSAYKGKKILIVNAPWLTIDDPQYAELDKLYKKYADKLVVIAFLADDFGIAPGAHGDAAKYRELSYNVSYPIASKVSIRGKDMAPIYQWLTDKQYNHLKSNEVKWNFQKYLINEKGELTDIFDPKISPLDNAIITAIER